MDPLQALSQVRRAPCEFLLCTVETITGRVGEVCNLLEALRGEVAVFRTEGG